MEKAYTLKHSVDNKVVPQSKISESRKVTTDHKKALQGMAWAAAGFSPSGLASVYQPVTKMTSLTVTADRKKKVVEMRYLRSHLK